MNDLYSIGMSATRAYGAALRVVGENVANADDPNYVRRSLGLAEAPLASLTSPLYRARSGGDGVLISGIQRSADGLRDAALRSATAGAGQSQTRAEWQGRIEQALGDGAAGIGSSMGEVFNAATRASADPAAPERRLELLSAINRSAQSFRSTGARLAETDSALGARVDALGAEADGQLAQLAEVNQALLSARPGSAARAQLLDRRDGLTRSLSELLPLNVSEDAKGGARLMLGGETLLDGVNVAALAITRDAAGLVSVTVGGTPVTADGAALGGLTLGAQTLSTRRAALDTLAADWAGLLNGWQAGGLTDAGTPGAPLLSGASAATLAAATQDPAALALADSAGVAGANLVTLDGLRTSSGMENRWQTQVQEQAQATRFALLDAEAAALHRDAAAAARDDVSGVNLDREAADMLRLQQAYAAAARVLQVARDTMQSILDIA